MWQKRNCPVEHSNPNEIQGWPVFQSLGIYHFTVTIKILFGNLKSMCELPDAVSDVVYFAIASWKWVSTLYIVQIFSKAFLLLNEVWFLFPESSHTLSPKPWYLSLVLCVRSFMTRMTFREKTVWTAYLRITLEEGAEANSCTEAKCTLPPMPLHHHWEINRWGKLERKASKFINERLPGSMGIIHRWVGLNWPSSVCKE